MKPEIEAMNRGFYQVIPHEILSVFDTDELDFLMNGQPEISVEDWKAHTVYKG